jgi:hypothetical protein
VTSLPQNIIGAFEFQRIIFIYHLLDKVRRGEKSEQPGEGIFVVLLFPRKLPKELINPAKP